MVLQHFSSAVLIGLKYIILLIISFSNTGKEFKTKHIIKSEESKLSP